jgi:hypothetical protein
VDINFQLMPTKVKFEFCQLYMHKGWIMNTEFRLMPIELSRTWSSTMSTPMFEPTSLSSEGHGSTLQNAHTTTLMHFMNYICIVHAQQ